MLGNKEVMAKNISKQMKLKRVDRKRMSDELKIKYTTLSDWINAKTYPRIDKIELMANYFGINKSDLVEDNEIKPLETNETEQVPVLGKIAAGKPLYSEQQVLRYSFVPSHINKLGKELFYLEVTGDSMNKEFAEGSEVLVDRNAHVENGNIAVVQVNGYDATVKKVRFDNEKIILMPMSTNENHLPQIYTKDDNITFIGRVIGMFKQY